MTYRYKGIITTIVFTLLVFGFSQLSEASTGSIIDSFSDLSKIASSSQVDIDTVAGQVGLSGTTVLYEQYTTFNNKVSLSTYGNYRRSQSFTATVDHVMEGVGVKMYKTNLPGTLYMELYNSDGGLPTGSILAVGSVSANGFTENYDGAWYNIFFDTPYSLTAGTQYVIVSNPPSSSQNAKVFWIGDLNGEYAGGTAGYSSSAGATWELTADWDCMFREWGEGYYSSGSLASSNLLSGLGVSSIDSFDYVASEIPDGSEMKMQFSLDNINWYSSGGVLGGWDTLTAGENSIDLSVLSWSGESFYYQMEFNSDDNGWVSSTLDEISLNYTGEGGVIPEPASLLLLGFGVVGIALFKRRLS